MPFEIPDSWEWVKLGELAYYKKGPFGSSLTKTMFVPEGDNTFKVYEQKNAIQKDASLGNYFISAEYFEKLKGFEVLPNDIIVSCAGTIGETFIMPNEIRRGIINQALMLVRLYLPSITPYYLIYFDSIIKGNSKKDGKGTAMANIPPFDTLKNYLFPLPPLAEQTRIISEIHRWFNLIEGIEVDKLDLLDAIKQTKSRILDLAIHGKLVEQDPNDEPASELLKQIAPNATLCDNSHYPNLLFEIPDNWVWVKLGDISDYGKCQNVSVEKIGQEEWVLELEDIEKDTARIIQFKTKSDREIKGTRHKFSKGCVLYSKLRTYLNKVLVPDKDGFCTTEIIPINFAANIDSDYLCSVLRSQYFMDYTNQKGYGVKMPRLSTTDAKNGFIPLPPFAEQKRIVKTIEDTFAVLDAIIQEL